MSPEQSISHEEELGLPENALLAIKLQEKLEEYYLAHWVNRHYGATSQAKIYRMAVNTTSAFMHFFREYRGSQFWGHIVLEGDEPKEYLYFTVEAVDLLNTMESKKELVGGGLRSHADNIKPAQIKAVKAVVGEIVEERKNK